MKNADVETKHFTPEKVLTTQAEGKRGARNKYICFCMTSALWSVYHSQLTMLVLELKRTEYEQNPSTCIPPDFGLFLLPKSSKALLASVSGKRLTGMQVSSCSLTQS